MAPPKKKHKKNQTNKTKLLALMRELSAELRGGNPTPTVDLDSRLSDEVGLDNLGRMELLARLERRLGVPLREDEALQAETPRELLAAIDTGARPPARAAAE